MQVLVVGYGSIGKGHVYNLLKLDNISKILIFTTSSAQIGIPDVNRKAEFVDSLAHPLINSINVDFAIVANETYKHMDTAIFLAEKGINLFIEKPLSHNLDKIELLEETVRRKKLKTFIGYNLRFLGAIEYIKTKLSQKIVGDLYFARIEVGQYLPLWRPDTDYRKSYSASKSRGGGVALDLSHEVDYMRYLFGNPHNWKVVRSKVSKLEIDSEDLFEGIYKYDNGFICNVHMDYLQSIKKREIRVEGSEGTILADLVKKNIKITGKDGKELLVSDANMFNVEQTYVDELSYFIKYLKGEAEPFITLNDGVNTLKLLEDRYVSKS
ncbi:MAG: Gfo/Idh/MocA family oxidoreductase [Candidatus Schekmanbacteria bacterium]|nr:Gfo/Idh/MocA family oxidoreductase [Candidatus Schekmanbacteria bacterium]